MKFRFDKGLICVVPDNKNLCYIRICAAEEELQQFPDLFYRMWMMQKIPDGLEFICQRDVDMTPEIHCQDRIFARIGEHWWENEEELQQFPDFDNPEEAS